MRARGNDPRFKGLTEQQRRERIEFVAGNVLFAMMHEVGHMLICELGLPFSDGRRTRPTFRGD